MVSFCDLFGLRRRQQPRVAVGWLVDIKLSEQAGYIGLYTLDIGINGTWLVGKRDRAQVEVLKEGQRVEMRLRLPPPIGPVEVEGELLWKRAEGESVQMGIEFTRMSREARQLIEDYIEAHPEEIAAGRE